MKAVCLLLLCMLAGQALATQSARSRMTAWEAKQWDRMGANPEEWKHDFENRSKGLFKAFIQKFGKTYSHEDPEKKAVFDENVKKAEELAEKDKTADFGVTPFSDKTAEEFEKMLGFKPNEEKDAEESGEVGKATSEEEKEEEEEHEEAAAASGEDDGEEEPPSLVQKNMRIRSRILHRTRTHHRNAPPAHPQRKCWREEGKVSSVKNQHYCGSCWAFAACGEVESQLMLAGKDEVDLSEQQMVDCLTQQGGCNGGVSETAIQQISATGGWASEESYPYAWGATDYTPPQRNTCDEEKSATKIAKVTGGTETAPGAYNSRTAAQVYTYVNAHGPAIAALDATPLQFYTGGVVTAATQCSSDPMQVNHAVLITGFDLEHENGPIFMVKNSWGSGWGEEGYFNIHVDACGIRSWVSGSKGAELVEGEGEEEESDDDE